VLVTKTGLGSPKWLRPAARRGALFLALTLGGGIGCKKPPRATPAPEPSVRAVASASSAPPPKPTASVDPQARRRALDEARAQLVAYQRALGEGRGLTKAGNYGAAVKAFSAALEARPDDPRAYAERGYAELLARDYDSAQRDLEKAVAGGGDRRLRAQTFFNLGLVREALNQDPTSAFALSNFLKPSSAAQKKLAGKSTCPIEVKRSPDIPQEVRYRDWLSFLADARDTFRNLEGLDLGSNAAAKRAMCFGEACAEAAGPWIALGLGEVFLVRPIAAGLAVTSVASSNRAAYCEPDTDAEVVESSKDALVVRAKESLLSEARFCSDDSHPAHDCTAEEEQEIEQNPDTNLEWVRGCHVQRYTKYEVFDRVKETWTLRLTQLDDPSPGLEDTEKVQVQLQPGRIVVSGPGCSEVFSLPSGR